MAKENIVIFHHDCEGTVKHWSILGELVRCKDCKHLNKEEMRCFEVEGLGYRNVVDEDFCSRGARMDEVKNG